ncbi:ADP-ribose pyrophosphatase [Anoxybacter fermentans]|uniref:ADP-ribose pyrophosphatase n=1 Tax=Anoxybacter fermentans TaxID=1323375 RepID=A0A3Q9HQT3_9FIRM|nr:NUDIX hydrolase [Anoxybacter fermentans]AZR73437.1 ADP-ribose pyrophosphatase [Anoxybacter fermentans]
MKFKEKTIESREIFKGKMINLRLDTVELPNGKISTREVVEHPGAVAVVALTSEEKVLLVRQYRKACEEELLEIPAGKLDPGEDPDDAAIRELEEETGYRAESLKKLVSCYTSPGFADEMVHIYLAENLTPTSQATDEDEFLSIHHFSWQEIIEMLKRGELKDAKTVTGLLMVMVQKGVEL